MLSYLMTLFILSVITGFICLLYRTFLSEDNQKIQSKDDIFKKKALNDKTSPPPSDSVLF